MKLHKIISGCALALGLAAFAAGNTQAGVVIGNTLYTPINVKGFVAYNDAKTGTIKRASLTTKAFLKLFGFPKGDQLAIVIGASGAGDVFLINKNTVVQDLTVGGYVIVTTDEVVSDTSGNSKSERYTSRGILTLNAYSNPQFIVNNGAVQNNAVSQVVAQGFDQAASEEASDYWLEVDGLYTYVETATAPDKNGKSKQTTNLKSTNFAGQTTALSGVGFDIDLSNIIVPVSASLTGAGGGTILAPR